MAERHRRNRAPLRQLLAVLEALPDALIVSAPDGRVVAANRAAEEMFGYPHGRLVGQPVESLVPPRLRAGHAARRAAFHADPARRPMGSRTGLLAVRRDGTEFPVDISLSFLASPDGNLVLSGVRDLSDRLLAEERLSESERNLRDLFENANDIIYTHDLDGTFTSVNPAGLRTYGYTEDEILGTNVAHVVDPAYMPVALEALARTLQHPEDSEPFELLTHAKDGSPIWIDVNLRVTLQDGRPVAVQGIARDITDRKRAEQALRETEQRLATFVANAPVVLFAVDLDGVFTLCDGKGLDALGLHPERVVGRSAYEIYADHPRVCANIRRALAGETFTDVGEIDGTYLEVHHSPIRDKQGRVTGMLGIGIDATRRILAEQALRTSEQRLQAVAANVPIGLCALDKDGAFILSEGKALASFGLRAGELVGRSAFDVYAGRPDIVASIRRALAGEEVSEQIELAGVTLETSLTPVFDADGAVSSVIVLAMDVTERAEAERALLSAMEFQDLVMQSTTDAIIAADVRGRITLVNRRACEMTGYRPEELIGESWRKIIAPECHDRMVAVLREAVKHGLPAEGFETELATSDGGRVQIAFNLAPLMERGKIVGAVSTAEDITERRRAAALVAGQARVLEMIAAGAAPLEALDAIARMVEEHAPDVRCGIWYRESDGATPRCGAARGLPAALVEVMDEAVAGVWGDGARDGERMIAADIAIDPRWEGLRDEALAHGVRSVWTTPIWSSDRSVLGTLSMFGERPGRPEEIHTRLAAVAGHLAGIVIERERADRARRESEERYRQIFERNTAIKFLVDPDTGRIVDANTAATEFYGYSYDELTSMTVFELNQLPRAEVERELARAKSEERSYFQFRHRIASGEVRDIEIYASPIDVNGRELICSIIHDISERKRTERQLASQRRLLELIAMGEPLETVLDMLVSTIEEQAPGALCSVLLLTPDGGHLTTASAPSLPEAYNAAVDGIAIGPSAGSCGTAAYRGAPVIVNDIATDPLWAEFRDLALPHGLRSCWSTPIFSSGGEVLGTFAVYYRESREPDAHHTALIRIATHVAGIAVERQRAEEAARNRTEELERLYGQLVRANAELAESKRRLEEKSALLEQALEHERDRARRDPLTGTLNHAAITDALRQTISDHAAESLAVAMVDVDGLKAANDTYGHQVGDAVLVLVAQALERHGAIVGRYGGDEFVAVLPGVDRPAAEAYREAVLGVLAGARVSDPETGTPVPVVVSIGLAVYPEEAEAVDDLIRLSDSAMYAARRQRALDGDGRSRSRRLGGDRAARMVGEIVPLLTSPGDLGNKLRLVSHRLSIGAGYDSVNFVLLGRKQTSVTSSTIHGLSERDYQAWDRHVAGPDHALTNLLRATKRPVLIDDVSQDQRLRPEERVMLVRAGLRSALVAPMLWQDEVVGLLSVASRRSAAFGPRDAEFVAAVATQVTAIVRMASMVDELQASSARLMRAHTETVLMLASAAEAHDQTTGRHLQRVRGLTEALALELGHAPDDARDLGLAAVLHDIGKIRVPDMVLGSAAKLAESEWVLMKQHTIWGSDFLAGQQGFELAAEVARSHHERWDGSGYPDGLAGDAIPESAQITAVADAFDAMTNDRPYRDGRPVADAVAEIVACSGTQFSPRVVDALVRLYERQALPLLQSDAEDGLAEERAA